MSIIKEAYLKHKLVVGHEGTSHKHRKVEIVLQEVRKVKVYSLFLILESTGLLAVFQSKAEKSERAGPEADQC